MRVLATVMSIFIYTLAAWFFAIAVVACFLKFRRMTFHLNWWAFVFPNVGFTIATIQIGKVLMSPGVEWVGSIMSIGVVVTWFFVAANHVWALWNRQILWEGMDEDMYKTEALNSHKMQQSRKGSVDEEKQD